MQKLFGSDEVIYHIDMGDVLLTKHCNFEEHVIKSKLISWADSSGEVIFIIIEDREPNTINEALKTMLERFNRP